ncbi:TonB-dependent receptor domain-containing protein [Novosphingobium sp. MMS21-SN21R]|uniref:TonB-dependent receptor n=1 Tax=Novosphingobium sp. MMS21-SN21R TaxID=2969298 RepID=UPI0028868D66|nr:TonB-dependent receptor [Novosphingobium sp. MMS21-SN21R]MDT0508439.1 TonB-dependent receptor [Novosphingobium sp. MMS21-SN21R]
MKALGHVSLGVIAMMMATPAIAAENAAEEQAAQASEGQGLAEIVVTATKRSENLQSVPVAVSAIPASALQAKGVFETSDLSNSMPNLQVSSPYGQTQPNFSLRGVGVGTEYNANAASPVGVYVDEVYQAFRSSHGQQLYDLQQIEVVRGPQGTLYGRNTTGGAINFITHAPSLSGNEGYVTAGYANFNRFSAEGALELTAVEDKLGVRIAGTYVNSDPYVHNRLAAGPGTASAFGLSGLNKNSGINPGGAETFGGRIIIRAQPSDRIDLRLKVYAAESEGGTETPLPTGQSRTSDLINYTSPNFLLGGLFGALSPAGLVPASYSQSGRGLGINEIEADTVGIARTRARGVVFDARFELSDNLKLVSITGYDDGLYQQTATDCDASPLRLCSIGYRSGFHAFNQDLRLDYNGGRFKMIVGAYYGKDSVTADNTPDFFNFTSDVRTAVGLPASYFNPGGAFNGAGLSAGSLPTGIRATQHFKQERDSFAIYGEGSFEVTSTVKFTAGLRYTKDNNHFRDGITTYFDDAGTARLITVSEFKQGGAFSPYFLQDVKNEAGQTVIPSFQGLGIPLPKGLSQDGSSGKFSGRAILDWKPVDGVMVYGSYSRGYRAGTFNGLAYGSANQVYFVKPEQVNAYEIGLKSRFWDNRGQFNISAFIYDYQGQQGQVVDASATANLISLDGTMKGMEAELILKPIESLTLNASFGLLDSSYKDGACPANPASIPKFPAQLGSCVVSSGGPVSVAGNPFPYAAKTSASLGFDYDAINDGTNKLTFHGDANYSGRFYFDSFKDYSRGPLPAVASGKFGNGEGNYWLLNGRITLARGNYSLAVWGKNLTNKVYYPFGISIENLFGNGYRVRAQPRTYGLEATMRF